MAVFICCVLKCNPILSGQPAWWCPTGQCKRQGSAVQRAVHGYKYDRPLYKVCLLQCWQPPATPAAGKADPTLLCMFKGSNGRIRIDSTV